MILMGKHITKMNTTSDNITNLVYNKTFLCQNNKLQLLTSRKGKLISETVYRGIKKIIQHDSHNCITSECGEDLSNHKLTNCEIEYDQFCCSDFTKLLCLEIKIKWVLSRNYIILSKH